MNSAVLASPLRDEESDFGRSLLLAAVAWLLIIYGVGRFLTAPPPAPPPPAPIDARIVQLPPPKVQPKQPPPLPVPQPMPLPIPVRHLVHHVVKPKPKPRPVVKPQPPAPKPAVEVMGARAIYHPLPQLPDNLREEAVNVAALARFTIAVDGSATVVLVQPTPDPRINQIILNTLRTWRFFPALKHGNPVASVQEIRVQVEVD